MKVNLKSLLLAVLVALALTGVPLAAAEEGPPDFHSEQNPTYVYGVGNRPGHEHYFKFSNQTGGFVTVSCNTSTASFRANTLPSASLTIIPKYSECTIGGEAALGLTNECEYQFALVAKSNPPTATLSISCPAGKEITFEGTKCTVHIPPQTGRQHVIFSNTGTGAERDIDATISTSELEYKITPGCAGVFTTETKKNGSFTEELTLTADREDRKTQQGLWVE